MIGKNWKRFWAISSGSQRQVGWVGIATEIQYSPPPPLPHISPHTPILFTLKLMQFSRKGKPYRNLLGKGLSKVNQTAIHTIKTLLKPTNQQQTILTSEHLRKCWSLGLGAAQCIGRRRWLKQGWHCCSTSSFTFPFFSLSQGYPSGSKSWQNFAF